MQHGPFRVAVLGATGLVGQRLIERLDGHPWFELQALAASERSAGRAYAESTRWRLPTAIPAAAAVQRVRSCRPDALGDCDVAFSALASGVAREIEPELAAAGLAVVSNSSAHRQSAETPLLVPEVNPEHLGLLEERREADAGFIVTNPNCSVAGLVLTLAALHRTFVVERVVVSTMQALSGAGLEGPGALELTDNVLPFIPGEEDKFEPEITKLLGRCTAGGIEPAPIRVSAHCHRVGTVDGHLQAVSVGLGRRASAEDARAAFESFTGAPGVERLPSAPRRPIEVRDEPDRPQPRLDRDAGAGMTVVVGRVRPCPVLDLRYELLVHNTIRGAAGAALLNAELLAVRKLLPRRGAP